MYILLVRGYEEDSIARINTRMHVSKSFSNSGTQKTLGATEAVQPNSITQSVDDKTFEPRLHI